MHDRHALVVGFLAAVLSSAESFAAAESSTVRVHLALEAPSQPSGEQVAGRIVVTGGESATSSVQAVAPGVVEVAVQPGQPFRLQAEFSGWWSEAVELKGPMPDVFLRLVPAATVRGQLKLPENETAFPPSLRVNVEEVPKPVKGAGGAVTFAPTKGLAWLDCPVKDGAFACVVPAGAVHLGLRARGYVTAFFWQQSLQPGSTKNLGTIALVRGASLVGWAVSEAGPGAGAIQLTLEVSSGGFPADPAKLALHSQKTVARPDGFFEFSGIPPGGYRLVARLAGFEENHHDGITIFAGSETRLREPLVLYRPTPFEVMISPPVAPSGSPWQVALVRSHGGGDDHREARGAAEVSGRFAAKGLIPGVYRLEIRDDLENLAHRGEIKVAPLAQPLWVALEIVEIWGTVRVGRAPLPEQDFELVGKSGSQIRFRTDEKGAYAGYVTAPGRWVLAAGADFLSGWARRSVDIPKKGGRVDLRIPAAQIRGVVVDKAGQPLGDALVNLMQSEPVATKSKADGSFTFQGLEERSYKLMAQSANNQLISNVVDAMGDVDPEADPIRVTLHRGVRVSGRVQSARGPLPASQITVCGRAAGVPNTLFCDGGATAAGGAFAVTVAQASEDVSWVAQSPGYALEVGAGPVASLDEIALGQEGGTLVLRVPKDRAGSLRPPILVQMGTGLIPLGVLSRWASSQGEAFESDATSSTMRIPMIEAGSYAFCDLEDAARAAAIRYGQAGFKQCAVGSLAPFGEIVLTLPVSAP